MTFWILANFVLRQVWLRQVSFIRYALRILMINEFKDVEFECPPDAAAQCVPTGMDVRQTPRGVFFCFFESPRSFALIVL